MVDKINANFYRAFEEKYRGTRELIKSRLRVYLPFVEPLLGFCGADKAVDLGCGRGEWLELLQESGFDAQGVDLDDGMLAACRERGLNVQAGDAVAFLKGLPEASQAVVSGFHFAEHIPFADLQVLVEEALRVLKPGGLLILETPNPENMVVGTANFYLDPAHQRPIPYQLLSFLPEHYGFEKVKIVRLQESAELSGDKVLTLLDALNGVSPDYAVVARKAGDADILAATNPAFEVEYGISLENLAVRFDRQAEAMAQQAESRAQQAEAIGRQAEHRAWQAEMKAQQAENKADQAESRAQQAEAIGRQAEYRAWQAETKAQQAENKADQADSRSQQAEAIAHQAEAIAKQAESRSQQAETKAHQAEAIAHQAESKAAEAQSHAYQINVRLNAVYSSYSWRITAPLRWTLSILRGLSLSAMKAYAKTLLGHAAGYVIARPRLRNAALALLDRLPSVKSRLSRILDGDATPQVAAAHVPTDPAHLTPRARRIYVDLKAAIEHRRRENR